MRCRRTPNSRRLGNVRENQFPTAMLIGATTSRPAQVVRSMLNGGGATAIATIIQTSTASIATNTA